MSHNALSVLLVEQLTFWKHLGPQIAAPPPSELCVPVLVDAEQLEDGEGVGADGRDLDDELKAEIEEHFSEIRGAGGEVTTVDPEHLTTHPLEVNSLWMIQGRFRAARALSPN